MKKGAGMENNGDKIEKNKEIKSKPLNGSISQGKEKTSLKNITINLPDVYCSVIDKLVKMKLIASRSEAVRMALREYLHKEYKNIDLLSYFDKKNLKI